MKQFIACFAASIALAAAAQTGLPDGHHDASATLAHVRKPQIAGKWWQVSGQPDLGDLNKTNQQPVDFAIWPARDGTWQLWSCIRNTREPGSTRLFYRWEGKDLSQSDWLPKGIAMRADPKLGEKQGGLQAPFVFRDRDRFIMFYGGWDSICSAESDDGKLFARRLNHEGKSTLFTEPDAHPRDPMLIRIGELWHCYYTAHPQKRGAVYCRTSQDLRQWGASRIVARGGQAKEGPYSAECPFVVEFEPGHFYLFRTQRYGLDAQTSVYFSRDPLDFGLDNDTGHFLCTMPVAAPEVIRHEGRWFIAALMPSLQGISVAPLRWE